jgi:putative restriction endonuclease
VANNWQEDELLLTLHLYCRTPFGKLHQTNPEIIKLAHIIGRTPSAIAMKACNFASLDPALAQKGLAGASKADRALWDAFMQNSTDIADKAEALYETRVLPTEPITPETEKPLQFPTGPTETIREVKVRRVQRFFRQTVLESYNNRCAISGLAIPELLVASHIIPWSEDESRRADPTNGIALNALYDKAFDRHLISFDEDFRLVLSPKIKEKQKDEMIQTYFLNYEGKKLDMPYRFYPNEGTIKMHRDRTMELVA